MTMSKIIVTQVVAGRKIKNQINTDMVERAVSTSGMSARDYEVLQIDPSVGAYLKMQSGDVIYIQESLEWYIAQDKHE
jgi:hypothetical protein